MTTNKIIIIDLEATCWKGHIPEGEISEIIEIGICELDSSTGLIQKNEGILIKPKRSKVSPFCTELTTLTQELLDREGISFEDAIQIVKERYQSKEFTWASYGNYDLNMLQRQCTARNIQFPLSKHHINVKSFFADTYGLSKPTGMNGALHLLEIPLEGTQHRGKDDANNIAKILNWSLANSKIPLEI